MDSSKKRLGEIKVNNQGCKMKIYYYNSATDIGVLFEDNTKLDKRVYSNFKKGSIANPNFTIDLVYKTYVNTTIRNWEILEIKKIKGINNFKIRCNTCKTIHPYFVTCATIVNKGKECLPCLYKSKQSGHYRVGNIINNLEVVKYVSSRELIVKCVDCNKEIECVAYSFQHSKVTCTCKSGISYNNVNYKSLQSLYNSLPNNLKEVLGYPGFCNQVKKTSISEAVSYMKSLPSKQEIKHNSIEYTSIKSVYTNLDEDLKKVLGYARFVERVNQTSIEETITYMKSVKVKPIKEKILGKVNNWNILEVYNVNKCKATCLLCNTTYDSVRYKNIVAEKSTKCGLCSLNGKPLNNFKFHKYLFTNKLTGDSMFSCTCLSCREDHIYSIAQTLVHKCNTK